MNIKLVFYLFVIAVMLTLNCISSMYLFDINGLLKFLVFFEIVLFLLISISKNGIFSLYSLFLFFSLFFIYDRIFFEFINYNDWNRSIGDFYFFDILYHFNEQTVYIFLKYSSYIFLFIDFGYYFLRKKVNKIFTKIPYMKAIKKTCFFLLFVSLPFLLYKAYLDFQFVRNSGYISILDRSDYPFFLKGVGTIFIGIFLTLLICNLTKKEIYLAFLLYFIQAFFTGLRGSRSIFLMAAITGIFWLWKNKFLKLNIKRILFVIGFAFIVMALMTQYLRGEKIGGNSLIDKIFYMLYGQGNTIGVPLYYIEYEEIIKDIQKIPLLLGDLLNFYDDSVLNAENLVGIVANKKNVYGGLGNSIFVELINLPIGVAVVFSCFLGFFVALIEKCITKRNLMNPILFIFASWIFVWPRFSMFNVLEIHNVIPVIMSYFILIFLLIFFKTLKKTRIDK